MNPIILDVVTQYFTSFDRFNPWGYGWYGLFYTCVVFYFFVWASISGRTQKLNEDIIDSLAPAFIVALFLTLVGIPNIIVGWAVFAVWLAGIKPKMNWYEWSRLAVKVCLIMGIGFFIDSSVSFFWTVILIGIFYVENKLRLRIEKREEKEKKSEKK